jgi:hypothetical protein
MLKELEGNGQENETFLVRERISAWSFGQLAVSSLCSF